MKRLVAFVVSLLFMLIFLTSQVFAASTEYQDDINRIEPDHAKKYYNLVLGTGEFGIGIDTSYAILQNIPQGSGGAIYRVQGAKSVSASIFNATGTTVSQNTAGQYVLSEPGIVGGSATTLVPMYSQSTKEAYVISDQQGYRMVFGFEKGYIFVPTNSVPNDLIPYAISFWASSNGIDYKRLQQTRTEQQTGHRYWERWTASVPEGMQYIKIEINDTPLVDAVDQSIQYPRSSRMVTALAQVNITGNALILGQADIPQDESLITTPPEDDTKIEEEKKSDGSKGGSATTEPSFGSDKVTPDKEKDSSTPSSKFEGSMPKNPSGGTGRSRGKSSSTAKKSADKTETEKTENSEEQSTEQQEYRVEQGQISRDNFSSGVTIYIVAVSALILFLLLRPQK